MWTYILATDITIFGRNHKNGLYIFYLVCFNKQKIYFGLTVVLSRLFSSDVYKKFFFYYFGCNILKTQRKFVSKRKLLYNVKNLSPNWSWVTWYDLHCVTIVSIFGTNYILRKIFIRLCLTIYNFYLFLKRSITFVNF